MPSLCVCFTSVGDEADKMKWVREVALSRFVVDGGVDAKVKFPVTKQ